MEHYKAGLFLERKTERINGRKREGSRIEKFFTHVSFLELSR
jgi:hypothetical protein